MNPRDFKAYRKCITTGCDSRVLPPRLKCNGCRKSKTYNTVALPPGPRKPTKLVRRTHRAKRQNPEVLGSVPYMRMSNL